MGEWEITGFHLPTSTLPEFGLNFPLPQDWFTGYRLGLHRVGLGWVGLGWIWFGVVLVRTDQDWKFQSWVFGSLLGDRLGWTGRLFGNICLPYNGQRISIILFRNISIYYLMIINRLFLILNHTSVTLTTL